MFTTIRFRKKQIKWNENKGLKIVVVIKHTDQTNRIIKKAAFIPLFSRKRPKPDKTVNNPN